jgi:APA family basic amino acid/polyamine antiporter
MTEDERRQSRMNDVSGDARVVDGAPVSPGLVRALGPVTAMAVVVGYVIGSGIYLKPGNIAAEVGDFRIIIAAWVTGGVLCFLGALSFAELAVMMPRAGGLYVYLGAAFGRPVAFLFGWSEFVVLRPAALGALSTASVGSLIKVLGVEMGGVGRALLAVCVIAAMAWVNVLGVAWGGRMQNVTTFVKVSFLAMIALLPLAMMPLSTSPVSVANFATTLPAVEQTSVVSRFGIALLAVMWAYNSWHQVTPVAEEIREPQRTLPLALLCGVGILTVLYVSANVAYHSVLPMDRMAKARDHAAEEFVQTLLGPIGSAVMSAVIMCSTLGTINAIMLVSPRIAFAMGRDGVFFRALGRVNDRFRTPATAIVVLAVMGSFLVVSSGVLVEHVATFSGKSLFAMLTDFVIFAASLFYVLGVLAVVVLRHRHPDWQRPYRTWGYPIVPLVFLAAYAWFLSQVYIGKPFEAKAGLVLIALGIPVYFGWQAWGTRDRN